MKNKFLYDLYERRLAHSLKAETAPHHVGVILDGNRRWARAGGNATAYGHRKGADKISDFLTWAQEASVKVVTLWMLSTDNLSRDSEELAPLLNIIVDATQTLSRQPRWQLRFVGDQSLLPAKVNRNLTKAIEYSQVHAESDPLIVNVAVGYGGRQEITDAVRALLRDYAQRGLNIEQAADVLTMDDITAHLYTAGVPDPDLVIRTSGEQRLSGFLLWQSVHSEYYFCEAYWPDFRRVDFLRALRDYAQRERRLGR